MTTDVATHKRVKAPSEKGGAWRVNPHVIPYLLPGAAPVATYLTGWLTHRWLMNNADPFVMMATVCLATMLATGLPLAAWHLFRPRHIHLRFLATGQTLWSCWWVVGLLIGAGEVATTNLVFVIGSCGIWALWALYRAARSRGEDSHGEDQGRLSIADTVKSLKAARVRSVEGDDKRLKVKGRLDSDAGTTVGAIQQERELIEVAEGLRPGAVTIHRDERRASDFEMDILPEDPLETWTDRPPPIAPGRSVAIPIPLGIDAAGNEVVKYTVGDQSRGIQVTHYKVVGGTGSGKTESTIGWIGGELMTRCDNVVLAVDTQKAHQSLRTIAGGLTKLIYKSEQVPTFLEGSHRMVMGRSQWLGRHKFAEWQEGCGLAFVTVLVEEASAEIFKDTDKWCDTLRIARSAGVEYIFSTQRPTWDYLPTQLRALLGGTLCFGLDEEKDGGRALPEHVLEAGVDPSEWGSRKAARAVLIGPARTQREEATPFRHYRTDRNALAQTVDDHASVRMRLEDEPDQVTIKAFGEAWEKLTSGPDFLAELENGTYVPPQAEPDKAEPEFSFEIDDSEDAMIPMPNMTPEERAEIEATDPDTEIEGYDEDMVFPAQPPVVKPSPEDAERMLRDHITDMRARGLREISPKIAVEFYLSIGYSRSWMSKALKKLATEPTPLISDDHEFPAGTYRITAGE